MKNLKLSKEICFRFPKIELHAHLNGSIRRSTLYELAEQQKLQNYHLDQFKVKDDLEDKMAHPFRVFDLIHKVVNSLEIVQRITNEMIIDFEEQNVCYLEIRTTPKDCAQYSSEDYLRTVLDEIIRCEKNMAVRLIISINRSEPVEKAFQTLNLIKKLKREPKYQKYIVGLDYSGNPSKNQFKDFLELFEDAKSNQICTTVHIAELDGEICLNETKSILQFKPDRLGHFNYFNSELYELLVKQLKIPIEMCPTSNLFTMDLKDYINHHFEMFFKDGHKICICTDDQGVFEANQTDEIFNICSAFNLNLDDLKNLMLKSSEMIFDQSQLNLIQSKIKNFQ